MADNCITCKRPVTLPQQGIQCGVCLQWNHKTCNTGKLPFILHFYLVCKTPLDLWGDVRYFATRNCSVVAYFFFFIGISQQDYWAAVHKAMGIDWVCTSCQFFRPVAESSRISMTESSAEILELSEFNPRSTHSDSFQSTIYDPPDQTTSETMVSLKLHVFVESCHFKM